jgi:protein-disulfide isomerase
LKRSGSSGRSRKKFIPVGAAIAAIALLGVVLAYQNSSTGSNEVGKAGNGSNIADTQDNSVSGSKLALSSLTSAGSPLRGDPTAPVTIVEFGDFQCPNCARFARNTEPQLEKEYFDTGRANMVFKHVPIRGPDSITASIAAQCAGDQGKFWEFYDLLYENQQAENSGWASAASMKEFASEIGLDRTEFDSCLDNKNYETFVENDFAFAREIGVSGTPSFVIVKSDGSEPEVILGAQPFSSFKAVLEKKLDSGF